MIEYVDHPIIESIQEDSEVHYNFVKLFCDVDPYKGCLWGTIIEGICYGRFVPSAKVLVEFLAWCNTQSGTPEELSIKFVEERLKIACRDFVPEAEEKPLS